MALQASDVAWELADHAGNYLAADERDAIFILLGVGDHLAAIEKLLKSVAQQRRALPEDTLARLRAMMHLYARESELAPILTQLASRHGRDGTSADAGVRSVQE